MMAAVVIARWQVPDAHGVSLLAYEVAIANSGSGANTTVETSALAPTAKYTVPSASSAAPLMETAS